MTSPDLLSPEGSKAIGIMITEIAKPEWNYQARTIENRKRDACSFIARYEAHFKKPFTGATAEQARKVLDVGLASGRAYDTLKDELIAMRLFYRVFMKLNPKIEANPFEGISAPGKPQARPRKKKDEPKHPIYFEATHNENEYLVGLAKGRTRQEALHQIIAEHRVAAQVATAQRLLEQNRVEIKQMLDESQQQFLSGVMGQLDLTENNVRAMLACLSALILNSAVKPVDFYLKSEGLLAEHGTNLMGNLNWYTKWLQADPDQRGPIRKDD